VPDAMTEALERHNRLLTDVIEDHGGVVVTSRGEGDSFFTVFPSAVAAVEAAGACQLRLGSEPWPAGASLRVRMGLHTGEARADGIDQVDHAPINRCARVKAAAHGGQVLITQVTRDLVEGRLGGGFGLRRLGEFRLREHRAHYRRVRRRRPPRRTRRGARAGRRRPGWRLRPAQPRGGASRARR